MHDIMRFMTKIDHDNWYRPVGGMKTILDGDFRSTLPIIRKGLKHNIVVLKKKKLLFFQLIHPFYWYIFFF